MFGVVWNTLQRSTFVEAHRLMSSISVMTSTTNAVKKYKWSRHFRIADTRCYFPRASENKRIKTHGWAVRMSTPGGRKVIMNRILKGRHVLSH